MATGLEALGAASAVVQVIAFAGSLVSLSFKIYDGMPPNENELEEYSAKMMDAARRVQSRGTQVPQGTQVGDKLSKVSKECIDAATELRKETQRLTKWYQNSKGKMFIAVYSAFRADRHRAKLNQLDKSLKMCKEVMETELLLKIWWGLYSPSPHQHLLTACCEQRPGYCDSTTTGSKIPKPGN